MEQTAEQIAQHYNAAMGSVNLINVLLEKTELTEQEQDTLRRNVMHLQIMLSQPYWSTEDLNPFDEAVKAGVIRLYGAQEEQ